MPTDHEIEAAAIALVAHAGGLVDLSGIGKPTMLALARAALEAAETVRMEQRLGPALHIERDRQRS